MSFGALPLWARLVLAAAAGFLCAPVMAITEREPYQSILMYSWAALFGAAVLAPYAWSCSARILRALALCAASSLIYAIAFNLAIDGYGPLKLSSDTSVVVSGGLGALLSAAAVKLTAASKLSLRGWTYVLIAGLAGGAVFILDETWIFAYAAWQVLVCLALFYAVRPQQPA